MYFDHISLIIRLSSLSKPCLPNKPLFSYFHVLVVCVQEPLHFIRVARRDMGGDYVPTAERDSPLLAIINCLWLLRERWGLRRLSQPQNVRLRGPVRSRSWAGLAQLL